MSSCRAASLSSFPVTLLSVGLGRPSLRPGAGGAEGHPTAQSPPCSGVLAAVVTKGRGVPCNSSGNADREAEGPGSKNRHLAGKQVAGDQELGADLSYHRPPGAGPARRDRKPPGRSGWVSLLLCFHGGTSNFLQFGGPRPTRCVMPQRVSKVERGGHLKSLRPRALSRGLGQATKARPAEGVLPQTHGAPRHPPRVQVQVGGEPGLLRTLRGRSAPVLGPGERTLRCLCCPRPSRPATRHVGVQRPGSRSHLLETYCIRGHVGVGGASGQGRSEDLPTSPALWGGVNRLRGLGRARERSLHPSREPRPGPR